MPENELEQLSEQAQTWHDLQEHDDNTCFCCCGDCDPDFGGTNPYYTAWSVAFHAVADEVERSE